MQGRGLPDITFSTRVRDESIGGENPYRWQDVTTSEVFGSKRVVVFSLPGAFTPTCSNEQCPAFERLYDEITAAGADEVIRITVNDAFVIHQWARHLGVSHVKFLPDGSGHFTRRMGMLVDKDRLGFGYRSWRYVMVVDDGVVEKWFEEPGINDEGADNDPYTVTNPEVVPDYLRQTKGVARQGLTACLADDGRRPGSRRFSRTQPASSGRAAHFVDVSQFPEPIVVEIGFPIELSDDLQARMGLAGQQAGIDLPPSRGSQKGLGEGAPGAVGRIENAIRRIRGIQPTKQGAVEIDRVFVRVEEPVEDDTAIDRQDIWVAADEVRWR